MIVRIKVGIYWGWKFEPKIFFFLHLILGSLFGLLLNFYLQTVLENAYGIIIFQMPQFAFSPKHLVFTLLIPNVVINMVISQSKALFTPVKQFTHTQNPSEIDSLDHQLETNFRSLQAFDPNSVVLPQLVVVGRSSGVVSGIGDTFNGIVSNPSSLNSQSNRNEDSSASGSNSQTPTSTTISGTSFDGFNSSFMGLATNPSNNSQSGTNQNSNVSPNQNSFPAFDPTPVVLPPPVVVNRNSGVVNGIDDTFSGIASDPSSLNSQSNRNEDSSVSGSSAQNSFPAFDPNSVVLPTPVVVNRSSGVVNGIDDTFNGIVSDPSQSSNAPTDQNPNTLQLNEAIQTQVTGQTLETPDQIQETESRTGFSSQQTNQGQEKLPQILSMQIPEPKNCFFSISSQAYSTVALDYSEQLRKQIESKIKEAESVSQMILTKAMYEEKYVSQKISFFKRTLQIPVYEVHAKKGKENFVLVGKNDREAILKVFGSKGSSIEQLEERFFAQEYIVGLKSQKDYIFLATERQRGPNRFDTRIYVFKINDEGSGLMEITALSKPGYFTGMEFKAQGLLTVIIESQMKQYSRGWSTLMPNEENMINSFYVCESCGSVKQYARDIFQVRFANTQASFEVSSYLFCPAISLVSSNQDQKYAQICLSSFPSGGLTSVDCLDPRENILMEHWNVPGVIVNSYNFGYIWDKMSSEWVFHAQSLIEGVSGISLNIYRNGNQSSFPYQTNTFPTYFGPSEGKIAVVEDSVIRILDISAPNYAQHRNEEGILILSNGYGFGRTKDGRNVKICHFPPDQSKIILPYEVNSAYSSMDYYNYLMNPQRQTINLKLPLSVQIEQDSAPTEGFIYLRAVEEQNTIMFDQYPFRRQRRTNKPVVYTHEGNAQIKFVYSDGANGLYSISNNEIQVRQQNSLQSMARTPLDGQIPSYLQNFIGKVKF